MQTKFPVFGTISKMKIKFTALLFLIVSVKIANAQKIQSLTDISGNNYSAVVINDLVWMNSDLKTTKFQDGTPIKFVYTDSIWRKSYIDKTPMAFQRNGNTFYNAYVVQTDKICPIGWRVPSNDDWNNLLQTAKEKTFNKIAVYNKKGFEFIFPGCKTRSGEFLSNKCVFWWSSSLENQYQSGIYTDDHSFKFVFGAYDAENGYNIRCVKNKK